MTSIFPKSILPLLHYWMDQIDLSWGHMFDVLDLCKTHPQTLIAKGKVQSGKSRFMIVINLLVSTLNIVPIFVLRNYSEDAKQLRDNFLAIQKDAIEAGFQFPFGLRMGRETSKATYQCVAILSNPAQLKKCLSFESFSLTIDEVDAVDSIDSEKVVVLAELKEKAKLVIGVSATILDALMKNEVDGSQIITLPVPLDYKGLSSITFCPIQGEYTGTTTKEILRKENLDLMEYLDAFSERSARHIPHMSLVHVCRCVEPNRTFQDTIRENHPELATFLFTGECLRFCIDGEFQTPVLLKRGKIQKVGLLHQEEDGWHAIRSKPSVRACIQWFKEHGGVERFPHLLILAGEIAGRGISFTSADHEWHLTEQYFLPSLKCDEPELIQKIRLCGRYQDDLPLTLYTTQKVWDDLKRADARLEEVVERVEESTYAAKDVMKGMSLHKSKFTKRSMTKWHGTPVKKSSVLDKDEWYVETELPKEDIDLVRLTIERHLLSARNTNIAVFLASLIPERSYEKEELLDLLERATYQLPKSILPSFFKKSDYGGVGGSLFDKKGDLYSIRNELATCWKQ